MNKKKTKTMKRRKRNRRNDRKNEEKRTERAAVENITKKEKENTINCMLSLAEVKHMSGRDKSVFSEVMRW